MAKHWHMAYLWSVWHLQVAAFNLDTQNVLQRSGDPGSLFGFSIAFHQQLSPARKNLWVKSNSYLSLCKWNQTLLTPEVLSPQIAGRSSTIKTSEPSECYRCCLPVWSYSNIRALSAHWVWQRRFVCLFYLKFIWVTFVYLLYCNQWWKADLNTLFTYMYLSWNLCTFITLLLYISEGNVVLDKSDLHSKLPTWFHVRKCLRPRFGVQIIQYFTQKSNIREK